MSRVKFFLGALCSCVIMTGCSESPKSGTTAQDTWAEAESLGALSATEGDSLNGVPLFDDNTGSMAALFEEKGYTFGPDIIKAAHSGDLGARYLLAQMYAYGIAGAKPNRQKAFRLYVGLADEGLHEAQAIAGYMMVYGLGTDENFDDGMQLMVQAANQDDGLAYLFLGNFYSKNAEPTPQNIQAAKLYYQNAVRLGVELAQQELDALEAKESAN